MTTEQIQALKTGDYVMCDGQKMRFLAVTSRGLVVAENYGGIANFFQGDDVKPCAPDPVVFEAIGVLDGVAAFHPGGGDYGQGALRAFISVYGHDYARYVGWTINATITLTPPAEVTE